jgi:molybdate-binding protein
MVSPRLNVHTRRLRDLLAANYRWVLRQEGAGSQRFLEETLSLHNTAFSELNVCERAYSEREAAALIAMCQADISPGIRGGSAEFGLDFISIGWEAFDLAVYRDVYFRALFQRFVKQLESPYIQSLAEALGGYDLRELGELVESA